MGSEWPTPRLKDVCSKIGSGATPKGGSSVYQDDGEFALIRSQNVRNDAFDHNGLAFIESHHAEKLANVAVEERDVLLNITGDSVARCCQVDPRVLPARVNQHVAIVRPKPETLDPLYLRYYFVSPLMQNEMLSLAGVGATRNALTKGMIEDFEIPLPPLPEQKAIAHILGALDDKIELNRRMNATLEGMAQALFKSWFVDFDPVIDNALAAGNPIPVELASRAEVRRQALANSGEPGRTNGTANREVAKAFPDSFYETEELGWIPEGWEVNTIGQTLATVLGGTPARKNEEFWTNGTVGWINSGKVNEFRIVEPSELITEEALKKSATKLLPKRTTLLAITGATLGQVSLNEIECCANQSVVGIIGSEQMPNEYVYSWINQIIGKLISSQTGGAQQHINKGNVQEAHILLPSTTVMDDFIGQARPAFDQIALGCFESQTLTKLRDTLLPKLISGELRIPEAEQLTKEALG